MLSEFEEVERTAGAEKAADLRKALHFLLRRQFVFAGDARTGTVYNAIMDGRFRNAVDGFFDSCGYRVHRDPEAQWAGITAIDEDVPVPVLSSALYQRFTSRGAAGFEDKVLSAMRFGFGGHLEKPVAKMS